MMTSSLVGWMLDMAQVAVLAWIVWALFKRNGLVKDIEQLERRFRELGTEQLRSFSKIFEENRRYRLIRDINLEKIEGVIKDRNKVEAMTPEEFNRIWRYIHGLEEEKEEQEEIENKINN